MHTSLNRKIPRLHVRAERRGTLEPVTVMERRPGGDAAWWDAVANSYSLRIKARVAHSFPLDLSTASKSDLPFGRSPWTFFLRTCGLLGFGTGPKTVMDQ